MSAADRMAVRMPGGEVRSVARRVGLAMIAQSRAKHAPGQSAPPARSQVQRRASAVTVVTAEHPGLDERREQLGLKDGEWQAERGAIKYPHVDATVSAIRDGEVPTPETVQHCGSEGTEGVPCTCDDDPTGLPIVAPAIERPKGNAGREAWAQYAAIHGVDVDDEMGRNEIRDAVVAKLETDRMSRPAFTDDSVQGGRPATPEDEPVTEDMVTSADPGERTT